jgi:phasin
MAAKGFPALPDRTETDRRQVRIPEHGRPERTSIMTEPRKPAKAAAPVIPLFEFPQFDLPKFDLPKFELPKFELPNVELPAELRAIAEQGVAQVKAVYERAKVAAEQATGVLEHSYAAASEGAAEYNRQVIDAARANVNAGFDYAIALLAVKSPTNVVEVSTAHAREQFQALTEQAKALGALVQKLAAETAEPIQTGVTKAFQNAA